MPASLLTGVHWLCNQCFFQLDLCVQALDLSQNSLSGRVPLAMLVERSQDEEPFPALRDVQIFRQWGSNLCAHVPGPQLSEIRNLPEIAKATRTGSSPENLADLSVISYTSDCSGGPGLRWSQVVSDAANYAHDGPPDLLDEPPVFSWPPRARRKQIFVGLCDLPEMLAFMCDALPASGSLLLRIQTSVTAT